MVCQRVNRSLRGCHRCPRCLTYPPLLRSQNEGYLCTYPFSEKRVGAFVCDALQTTKHSPGLQLRCALACLRSLHASSCGFSVVCFQKLVLALSDCCMYLWAQRKSKAHVSGSPDGFAFHRQNHERICSSTCHANPSKRQGLAHRVVRVNFVELFGSDIHTHSPRKPNRTQNPQVLMLVWTWFKYSFLPPRQFQVYFSRPTQVRSGSRVGCPAAV